MLCRVCEWGRVRSDDAGSIAVQSLQLTVVERVVVRIWTVMARVRVEQGAVTWS